MGPAGSDRARGPRQLMGLVALVGLASLFALAHAHPSNRPPASHPVPLVSVQTTSGLVRGLRGAQVCKFLSVPYAEAPVGVLRFARPVELVGREAAGGELIEATAYAQTCPQHRHLERFISPLLNVDRSHSTSEDCLRLSVFAPTSALEGAQAAHLLALNESETRESANAKLPVIVWLPGEGFDFADERQFDGSQLAARTRSLVVSVQYRVGVLGFLRQPGANVTGNMGLHDQLAALRWVRRNINSFGGDERRVTLMGRFSGSMAISSLLTAPSGHLLLANEREGGGALFQRAILLSGLAVRDWTIEGPAETEARVRSMEQLALERGLCSQAQLADQHQQQQQQRLSCFQQLPVDQLMALSGHGWKLTQDSELVGPLDPVETLRAHPERLNGQVEAIMLGETESEGTLCLYRHLLEARQSKFAALLEANRLTARHLFEMIRDDSRVYFKRNITRTDPIQAALESLIANERDELEHSNSSSSNEADENEDDENAVDPQKDQQRAASFRSKYLSACSSFMVKAHNRRFKRLLQARNRRLATEAGGKRLHLIHYSLRHKPSFSLAPAYVETAAHGDDVPLIFGLVFNHNQQAAPISRGDLLLTQRLMALVGDFVHGSGQQASTGWAHQLAGGDGEQVRSFDLAEGEAQAEGGESGAQAAPRLVVEDKELADWPRPTTSTARAQQPPGGAARLFRGSGGGSTTTTTSTTITSSTSTTTTTTSPLADSLLAAAELSRFLAVLLLGTCVAIVALMSVCMILAVLVVRTASRPRPQLPPSPLGASGGGGGGGGGQLLLRSPSSASMAAAAATPEKTAGCNICEHESRAANSLEAVLAASSPPGRPAAGAGAGKKPNERPFCNVLAKLRHQHLQQAAADRGPASALQTVNGGQQQRRRQ